MPDMNAEELAEDLEIEDGEAITGGMQVGPVVKSPLVSEELGKGIKHS